MYFDDWPGPPEGERPSAYIIMVGDTEIRPSFDIDIGFAAQSILLGAVEKGLGGCVIGRLQKEALRQRLAIPDRYQILYVLALGKPKETVVLEPMEPSGDFKYWRDAGGVHHVPKRSLDEILIG